MNIFRGMTILWTFFLIGVGGCWGCSWEVITTQFRLFSSLQVKVLNGLYLLRVANISNVLGMTDIPEIVWG